MSTSPGGPDQGDPGGTAVPSEDGWTPDADQESMGAAQAGAMPGEGRGYGGGHGRHRRDDDEGDEGERNVGG